MVTEYILLTVEYIEKYLRVEAIGAIIILTLLITATLGIVFLLFRGFRLWYWRVNDQVAALEKINQKLEELNEVIPTITAPSIPGNENNKTSEEGDVDIALEVESKNIEGQKHSFNGSEECFVCEEKKEGFNVGKTGKIYSENELREQIQF